MARVRPGEQRTTHESNAKRALGEAVAFDNAIAAALAKAKETDPTLEHTLIVVTADHDHTMTLNGYAQRTGPTTATSAGVLGVVKDVVSGNPSLDADGMPYSILALRQRRNRVAGARTSVDDATASALSYHQEAAVKMSAGGETHGGTDVALMAIGMGADRFHGFMTNTTVYTNLRAIAGL